MAPIPKLQKAMDQLKILLHKKPKTMATSDAGNSDEPATILVTSSSTPIHKISKETFETTYGFAEIIQICLDTIDDRCPENETRLKNAVNNVRDLLIMKHGGTTPMEMLKLLATHGYDIDINRDKTIPVENMVNKWVDRKWNRGMWMTLWEFIDAKKTPLNPKNILRLTFFLEDLILDIDLAFPVAVEIKSHSF